MSDGGKDDDARIEIWRRSSLQTRMDEVQEKEVGQVVRAKLGLEAVLSASFRTSHNTSVGDEDISFAQRLVKSLANRRTSARELRSRLKIWQWGCFAKSPRACLALSGLRAVRYNVALVRARAFAASTPSPEQQPVMRMVLSVH